jgi:hypothetical protein
MLKILIVPAAIVLAWLATVGYGAHYLAERVAGAMDNHANMIAAQR